MKKMLGTKVTLIALLAILALAALPGTEAGAFHKLERMSLLWDISQTKVINPGREVETPQGKVISGVVLEGMAKALSEFPLREGTFHLQLTCFSPKQDMPGQKAGHWYLKGDWILSPKSVQQQAMQRRHGEVFLKGILLAEVPFNPLSEKGSIEAQIKINPGHNFGTLVRGKGTLRGNELFNGQMALSVIPRKLNPNARPRG